MNIHALVNDKSSKGKAVIEDHSIDGDIQVHPLTYTEESSQVIMGVQNFILD